MKKSITLISTQLKDLNATDQIVTADALTTYLEENTTSIISEINNTESTLSSKIDSTQTIITNQISSTENTLTAKIDSSQAFIINTITESKFNDTELMSKLDEILNKIGNAETLLNML